MARTVKHDHSKLEANSFVVLPHACQYDVNTSSRDRDPWTDQAGRARTKKGRIRSILVFESYIAVKRLSGRQKRCETLCGCPAKSDLAVVESRTFPFLVPGQITNRSRTAEDVPVLRGQALPPSHSVVRFVAPPVRETIFIGTASSPHTIVASFQRNTQFDDPLEACRCRFVG